MEYSQVTTPELEQRFDTLYAQINAALDSLPAATWTEPYRAAKRELMSLETEFHAIGRELAERAAARTAHWSALQAEVMTGCPYMQDMPAATADAGTDG